MLFAVLLLMQNAFYDCYSETLLEMHYFLKCKLDVPFGNLGPIFIIVCLNWEEMGVCLEWERERGDEAQLSTINILWNFTVLISIGCPPFLTEHYCSLPLYSASSVSEYTVQFTGAWRSPVWQPVSTNQGLLGKARGLRPRKGIVSNV